MCMVQCEVAVEPYPARNDRLQDQATEVTFRTGGKFTELGHEYRRLAEAQGGVDQETEEGKSHPATRASLRDLCI